MLARLNRLARRTAAALALASALASGLAAPAAAAPALWAIRDADSTIYLFGTVHVLRPDTAWRTPGIEAALAESDELVIEVLGADDPAAARPLILKYGVSTDGPLSSKLSPQDQVRLEAAAAAAGLPPQALEPLRPWLAAMSLSIAPVIKAGYRVGSGVETVLTAEARAKGRPVEGLETLEQQIGFFAGLPPEIELAMLKSTLEEVDEGPAKLDALVKAWADADLDLLEREFVTEMREKHPEVYEALAARRNRDWADQLKAKLAGSGVSFVAVGAGHLVGPDSVQAELAKRGVTVERR